MIPYKLNQLHLVIIYIVYKVLRKDNNLNTNILNTRKWSTIKYKIVYNNLICID